jgi:predicted nucleic acid-binding protein
VSGTGGRPAIISFVTVAEMRYGARVAGWGTKRLQRLEHELTRAEVVWAGSELAEKYAELRAWCSRTGMGCIRRLMRRTAG